MSRVLIFKDVLCFNEAIYPIPKINFARIIGFIDKESELGEIYRRNKHKSRFYKIAEFFSTEEVLACLSEAGFGDFETKQTIFQEKDTGRIENGFGTGSFVVIKGLKINKSDNLRSFLPKTQN